MLKGLTVVAVAAALALVWLLRLQATSPEQAPDPVWLEGGATGAAPAADRVPSSDPLRELVDARTKGPDASGVFVVTGRCVSELGGPLAAVRVATRPAPATELPEELARETFTDPDGSFLLDWPLADVPRELQLVAQAPDFVPVWIHLEASAEESPVDLGTLVLRVGSAAECRIVDQHGRPLPEVSLLLRRSGQPVGAAARVAEPSVVSSGASDGDGRVELPGLLGAGEWELVCRGLGVQDWSPRQLTIAPGTPPRVEIVCQYFAPIEGRVVLRDGTDFAEDQAGMVKISGFGGLVGRTRIDARGAVAGGSAAGSRVASDGSFTLKAMRGAEPEVELVLGGAGGLVAEPVHARWGDRGVEVLADRKPRLRVEVREAGGGDPVLDYGISLQGDPEAFRLQELGQFSPGWVEAVLPETGDLWLHVVPRGELAPIGPVRIEDGRDEIRVVLEAPVTLELEVRDATGAPVEGASCGLVALAEGLELTSNEFLASATSRSLFGGSARALVWATSTTNAEGQVWLRWPNLEGRRYYVDVKAPLQGHLQAPILAHSSSASVSFTAGGQLVCRLAGDWPSRGRLLVEQRSGAREQQHAGSGGVPMKPEQSHSFIGLAGGEWRVVPVILGVEGSSPLVSVAAGEVTTVVLEARDHLIPAQAANLLLDGARAADGMALLRGPKAELYGSLQEQTMELEVRSGSIALPALLPGEYEVLVGDHLGRLILTSPGEVVGQVELERMPH
ncbi:MAG: carboxypeptidase-like regulatory domain-containing protein [Planctomycetota bacterium]|nr:carboxypeptidase-like regulatory domain-containing protein [Planctomycetota bacterium]